MSATPTLAGRGARLVAVLIDLVLVFAFGLFLMLATGALEDAEDYAGSWFLLRIPLLGIVSYLILNTWLLWRRGQTVGKLIMQIRIVSSRNEPAPLWKLLLLRAFYFLELYAIASPFLVLALLDQVLIFRQDRRCLHDIISDTQVVRLGG